MTKVAIEKEKLDLLASVISEASGETLPLTLDEMTAIVSTSGGGGEDALTIAEVTVTTSITGRFLGPISYVDWPDDEPVEMEIGNPTATGSWSASGMSFNIRFKPPHTYPPDTYLYPSTFLYFATTQNCTITTNNQASYPGNDFTIGTCKFYQIAIYGDGAQITIT